MVSQYELPVVIIDKILEDLWQNVFYLMVLGISGCMALNND
jgi:hypothetical protein